MAAFDDGSVSLRLYPHDLAPGPALDELCAQAAMAVAAGFDGVMVSERHGGIVGNVPNPIQVAGWLAREMDGGWVAPCPVLSLLRPPPLIVEEIAWLAARYPGRVGVGLGAGGNALDFSLYGTHDEDLARRFGDVLGFVTAHLGGRADDVLTRDRAVARCAEHPVPVLSAAMSATAARRAAACGAGIIGSSLLDLDTERRIGDAYRGAGGSGPSVLIRFVWLGEPPRDAIAAKYGDYQRSTAAAGRRISGASEILAREDPAELADELVAALEHAGHGALHLRVHVPGVPPEAVREQIGEIARSVLPRVRAALPAR
jgi:alkanesulfonate monooxygenase SsuD/methylene tetrahydromethanopterin reductase-like flavin-dependent oxidoreductase (luciferase family)